MELVALRKVLERISEDLDAIDEAYGLLSSDQKAVLLRDIEYLFVDNIAEEIRFVFYDPRNRGSVFLQYVYSPDGIRRPSGMIDAMKEDIPGELVFDVFVEFTEAFLHLEPEQQNQLLRNTERDWYAYE